MNRNYWPAIGLLAVGYGFCAVFKESYMEAFYASGVGGVCFVLAIVKELKGAE